MYKTPLFKYSICNPKQNFVLPRSFISNSFFMQYCLCELIRSSNDVYVTNI